MPGRMDKFLLDIAERPPFKLRDWGTSGGITTIIPGRGGDVKKRTGRSTRDVLGGQGQGIEAMVDHSLLGDIAR